MLSVPFPQMSHSTEASIPEVSRQGRDNQRYAATGERLVAGSIPYRWVDDARLPSSVQVLLITSSGGNGWVFPKGGWEMDETAESAALRETIEEGGVRGDLDPVLLGAYPYSNRKTSPTRKGCIAHMFAMYVREELSVWPESHNRERAWCSVEEASSKCRHSWMRRALHDWMRRQGWVEMADRLDQDVCSVQTTQSYSEECQEPMSKTCGLEAGHKHCS